MTSPDTPDAAPAPVAPTYTSLLRIPEFTPFFLSSSLQVAASTVGGLALGTLVYEATNSPLLSALSMFGPSLAQVLGATTLLSAADRVPPRGALTAAAGAFAAVMAVLALPSLPTWTVFPLVLALGLVSSVTGGVRWGLLDEILPKGSYLLGRSLLNIVNGLMQITGYAAGGVLVAFLSPRTTLLVSAALYAVAALVTRFGLGARPPRSSGRPSVGETWRTNARLLSSAPRRLTYLGLWIPNGLVVGCEALFVPYAPGHAGLLFAAAALGMLVGDVSTGRLVPARVRGRLATPLLLLLATPYLFFVLRPPVLVAAGCAALASIGFGASLVQQQRLLSLTPDRLTGHALGLHSAGTLALQGLSAALAGGLADLTSPATAITVLAGTSVAVTLILWTADRRHGRRPVAETGERVGVSR
ncbi:MFS transporter [Streptomyces sp. CRN 30]|uniref:MFS transporter n=1 Tax=Streptomyces sp. CRN 30 TaxID=3075613 RepID=UPI002A81D276|nr:MFS transporter [Streptomyces sp. CRN 30]